MVHRACVSGGQRGDNFVNPRSVARLASVPRRAVSMLCARAMLAVGSLWNSTSSSPARLCRAALGRFRPRPSHRICWPRAERDRKPISAHAARCRSRCSVAITMAALFHPALCRFLILYGVLYAGFGVQSPYLPTFLGSRGLSPEAIALVLAASGAVRLVAGPAAGRFADRLDAPRAREKGRRALAREEPPRSI